MLCPRYSNIRGARPLVPAFDAELNFLPLPQVIEIEFSNGGVVKEYLFAIVCIDESKSAIADQLLNSSSHSDTSTSREKGSEVWSVDLDLNSEL